VGSEMSWLIGGGDDGVGERVIMVLLLVVFLCNERDCSQMCLVHEVQIRCMLIPLCSV
jgi:hypothetical protein